MASKLTSRETGAVLVLFVASAILLAMYSFQTTASKHLDSVFLFEGLDSIRKGGVADSASVSGAPIIGELFATLSGAYCASPLMAPEAPYHILRNHAYLALYLLAIPAYFMSPEAVLALANALAHLVLLFLPYLYLRWKRVTMLRSVVFVLCVATYSAWSLSLVGDYYMDRLYMLFMTPVLFGVQVLITSARASRRAIAFGLMCALCAALCTERGAIMLAGLMCFYLLFYRAELKSKAVLPLMAASLAVLVIYVVLYVSAYYRDSWSGAGILGSRIGGLAMLEDRLISPDGRMFVLVNLLPLGLLALFSGYRYILLAACASLPNLLVTVGGAELTGWDTHYHAMYMPFLVFAACVGYERIAQWAEASKVMAVMVPLTIAAGALTVAGFLNPRSGFVSEATFAGIKEGIFGSAWTYYLDKASSRQRITIEVFNSMAAIIPLGATVSAAEGAMPSLYAGRHLVNFPLGLEESEYLAIPGVAADGKLAALEAWVTYLDQEEDYAIKRCLLDRIQARGFTLLRDFPQAHYVVMKRTAPDSRY